jgi:AraC family transcriptional regulator
MSHDSDVGAGRYSAKTGPGALVLVPPGVATRIAVHVPHRIRVFALPAARFGPLLSEVRTASDPFDFGPLHAGPFVSPAITALTDQLWARATGEGANRLMAESAALAILGELDRLATGRRRPVQGGLTPRTARRCCDYLRAHLAEEVSIGTLATLAGLSPFHFARAFKTTTGLPPAAWQRRLRAERAQEMLRHTDVPVGEIAVAVVYETPQAFARMFRAETGTSPGDWRRMAQG